MTRYLLVLIGGGTGSLVRFMAGSAIMTVSLGYLAVWLGAMLGRR